MIGGGIGWVILGQFWEEFRGDPRGGSTGDWSEDSRGHFMVNYRDDFRSDSKYLHSPLGLRSKQEFQD